LKRQNYQPELIEKQFNKALSTDRKYILRPKNREKKKGFPLVLNYNPRLPDITKIIRAHSSIISNSELLQAIFPSKSIMPALRRMKNLKELLAPSRYKTNIDIPSTRNDNGCFKCNKRCDFCKNFLNQSDNFRSCSTGHIYKIKQPITCTSANIIYLISCDKCKLQYVGSTSNQFKVRFRNHKSAMLTKKNNCEVAIHYNSSPHQLSEFSFICIEQINDLDNTDAKLLSREAYWATQLRTLRPNGLNKRQEFKSKRRIHFSN
jgi:hypothetical protein